MKIFVNGKAVEVETNSKVCDILSGYDVFVRNGYGIDKNYCCQKRRNTRRGQFERYDFISKR
ncbi:MAG TPA: hypothetical protein PLZ09_03050 [Clostridia bacterium]|nr:hypothetical protein [Clostridia bacterium]